MLVIRCEFSEEIGYGHFFRSLVLAKLLNDYQSVRVAVPENLFSEASKITPKNIRLISIPENKLYSSEIIFYPKDTTTIFLDLSHKNNIENTTNLNYLIDEVLSRNINLIFINGLEKERFKLDSFNKRIYEIIPYETSKLKIQNIKHKILYGANYSIHNPDFYQNFRKRKYLTQPRKFVITFGGSDPCSHTIKILKSIININIRLNVRVLIGPGFSKKNKEIINLVAARRSYKVIKNNQDIVKHLDWADVCICGSGITRYECLAIGVPVIFGAINSYHIKLSLSYQKMGTSLFLGDLSRVSNTDIQNIILSFNNNLNLRREILQNIFKLRRKGYGLMNLLKKLNKERVI